MSKLKLEISNEVLLKLLGAEDPEVFLEIRKWIVGEFTRRYLKELVHTDAVQGVQEVLKAAIKQEIEQEVGKYNGWSVTLSPKILQSLENHARTIINKETTNIMDNVSLAVNNAFKQFQPENLEKLIDQKLEYLTERLVESKVKERLEAISKGINNQK